MTDIIRILEAYKCGEEHMPGWHCEYCPYDYGYLDETGDHAIWWCNTDQITEDAINMLQKIVGVLVNGR